MPRVSELYTVWTGDDTCGLKQAEQVAWSIEDVIAKDRMGIGDRMGSENDLAARFGTGLGVVREALEILDVRGVCSVRRGPGGGVFVTHPSEQMTAQINVNYFIRAKTTFLHLWEARDLWRSMRSAENATENPAMRLFGESLKQLDQCMPRKFRDNLTDRQYSIANCALSEVSTFNWQRYAPVRLSKSKQVAWTISQAIAAGRYGTQRRLGSECDLGYEFAISHASMRQVTRLLETFGIVESHPGRGHGIIISEPSAFPIIRAMDSYFLALRMTPQHWREAISTFGEAALDLIIQRQDEQQISFLLVGKSTLETADEKIKVAISRELLQSLIGLLENPIIMLFWRALAGYTFRAFDEANREHSSGGQLIPICLTDIFDAALTGDRHEVLKSYLQLFPKKRVNRWTV